MNVRKSVEFPWRRPLVAVLSVGVIATLIFFGARTDRVSERIISGTYIMSKTFNADTLRLLADGRYSRTFVAPGKASVTDTGAWFLSRDRTLVGLRNYPKRWAFVHDLMGDTTNGRVLAIPSTVGLRVSRTWYGRRRLGWYPEFGWFYVRSNTGYRRGT
ncbi:MAG TPA: hypothetical protein VE967_07950 [Gemmatimonadaceae bacterium]|nr:hypothetical protein [Gemmatimonadaceae bacterium]